MADRQEVQRWLSACTVAGYDAPDGDNSHASFEVPAPTLAALCRAWLALDEAPVGIVDIVTGWDDGSGAIEVHYEDGKPDIQLKKRVRIVKEVG